MDAQPARRMALMPAVKTIAMMINIFFFILCATNSSKHKLLPFKGRAYCVGQVGARESHGHKKHENPQKEDACFLRLE
jgi:hypothetical protein